MQNYFRYYCKDQFVYIFYVLINFFFCLFFFFLLPSLLSSSLPFFLSSFLHKALTECLLSTRQVRFLPLIVKYRFKWNQRKVSWGDREEGSITFLLLDGLVVLPWLINAGDFRGLYSWPTSPGSESFQSTPETSQGVHGRDERMG